MSSPIFSIQGVESAEHAAVPTLLFKLAIDGDSRLQAMTLNAQIRLAAAQRPYSASEQTGLKEIFGSFGGWTQPLHSLLWTHSMVHVPQFSQRALVDLPVICTYDFEIVSAKYFHALDGGAIPLEFFFSGTTFSYDEAGGLHIAPISWDREARYRLPLSLWRQTMESYFPNSAWLRLHRDTFDRLYRYRSRKGWPTWEATLDDLLEEVP